MSNLKMVEVGTDKKGESLYNVRHKSGELVSTETLSKKEAEKIMQGLTKKGNTKTKKAGK
jgi:hypothetical protein|tara:strand:- start:176 stop:355 length:180 start_codon:yes stop_codon:yes gene_type:complete